MTKRALHRGVVVGVILLAVMVLFVLLVTSIAAQVSQVGIVEPYQADPTCYMYEPIENDPYDIIKAQTNAEITVNITPSSDVPTDVVALLKCQTTITNIRGHAITYSGSGGTSCRAHFEPQSITETALTEYWSQTISASGNATLTCHFKRRLPF